MDTNDNPTAPEPDSAPVVYDRHGHLALNATNSQLCEAVGLDPNEVIGFQLTVKGGELPQLQVFALPPADDAESADWAAKLGKAMASTTSVVLPGAITGDAAMVQMPEPLIPLGARVPAHISEMSAAAGVLRMLADVLNGAGCDAETRDWLTEGARELAGRFEDKTVQAVADSERDRG